jgi:hypothetical protein
MSGQFLPVPIFFGLHVIEVRVGADSLVHWLVCSIEGHVFATVHSGAQSLDFRTFGGGVAETKPVTNMDCTVDPKRDITLSSLQRAAALVGQRVVIELV